MGYLYMGFENILPDDEDSSESRQKHSSSTDESSSHSVSHGGKSKYLSSENWRDIFEVLEDQLDIKASELWALPESEQEELLQKATQLVDSMGTWTGSGEIVEVRCVVCGHECKDDGVVLEEYNVCRGHSAQEVRTAINELEDKQYNE